jgi:hypothetical protein
MYTIQYFYLLSYIYGCTHRKDFVEKRIEKAKGQRYYNYS